MATRVIESSVRLDLREEVCPFSFVRTKLQLEKMKPGEILEVVLRGAAIENVPRSAEREGHVVLHHERLGGDYVFYIKKMDCEKRDHACARRDCFHCHDILRDRALEARKEADPEKRLKDLEEGSARLGGASAEEVLAWALEFFGKEKIALATSFGPEDMVLTDMLARIEPAARIFTLDTGRLYQETYCVMDRTMKKYGMKVEVYCPDARELEELTREYGPNLFYDSVENRMSCCRIRKINPLKRVLSTLDAWTCGLRREQSPTRTGVSKVEVVGRDNIIAKINPLAEWTEKDVWDYIRKYDVPSNELHACGFPSIGCAPCTRALKPGEDIRAGRWWWEQPAQKECGLHGKK